MRENERNVIVAAVVGVGLVAGIAPVYGAPGTWLAAPADSDWANAGNWVGGTIAGTNDGTSTATAAATVGDATFSSSNQLTVQPDLNRQVNNLIFSNTAGNYIVGSGVTPNTLYLRGSITGNNASTITFNSPSRTLGNSTATAATGQVFNFEGLYTLAHGQSFITNASGTINFNGGFSSSSTSGVDRRANVTLGGTAIINFNAPSPAAQRVGISISGTGTANLNAEHVIFGESANGGPGNRIFSLQTGGSGKLNVNEADAIYGTAGLMAGNATSGTTSVVTINDDQAYTGRLSSGVSAGQSVGTLLGNVVFSANVNQPITSVQVPDIAANGHTTATTATAHATLLVNNGPSSTGSATGNSDVNIVTGTLGGHGRIANTDVMIGANTYQQGVTLHKRTNTTNSTVTYGKLSPGASAGAIGTLAFDLGSKGLNIAAPVSDGNSQVLLFDLNTVSNSDKVVLGGSTALHIGTGGLELDDFAFTLTENFGDGIYTLFDTNALIDGTLGSNITGTLGDFDVKLSFANDNQDVVLLVGTAIPEPSTLAVLGLAAMGLGRRRRG